MKHNLQPEHLIIDCCNNIFKMAEKKLGKSFTCTHELPEFLFYNLTKAI